MNDPQWSEYGHQKSLQEILEELSVYCAMNGLPAKNKIKLILPEEILMHYRKIWFAKERIVLDGNIVAEPIPLNKPVLYTDTGTIALFSSEEHTVSKKRKKK